MNKYSNSLYATLSSPDFNKFLQNKINNHNMLDILQLSAKLGISINTLMEMINRYRESQVCKH